MDFSFDAQTMFGLTYFRRGNRSAGLLLADLKSGISCGIATFLNFGIVLRVLSITQNRTCGSASRDERGIRSTDRHIRYAGKIWQ